MQVDSMFKIKIDDYCIIMRDSLGECFNLNDNEYIFDLISLGETCKFQNSSWVVRRNNWDIYFNQDNVEDSIYFLQTGMWVPLKSHSYEDDVVMLYRSLLKAGLLVLNVNTEPNVKQIFSQGLLKDDAHALSIPKVIERLPYFGGIRYNIKCEVLASNNLLVFNNRIQFMNWETHELTIPISQVISCEIEKSLVQITTGTAHNQESIMLISSSNHAIVSQINHYLNNQ
eukprot:NODE_33_length_32023_cov_0.217579.p14 type:complete len:228 gc:universal NODE_33_length_32023_cov_0.217579:1628-945(-)